MTALPLFEALQHTYVGETIRHSAALIALLEIVHLIGLTLLLGTILMVDLSLLGLGISGIASRSDRRSGDATGDRTEARVTWTCNHSSQ